MAVDRTLGWLPGGGPGGRHRGRDGEAHRRAKRSGEAARAEQAISRGFQVHATERVLVSSPNLQAGEPAFAAALGDVVNRVTATEQVVNLRSPLDPAAPGQVSHDGHAALVEFELAGSRQDAATTVGSVLVAVQAAAAAHPAVRIEQAGDMPASRRPTPTRCCGTSAKPRNSPSRSR